MEDDLAALPDLTEDSLIERLEKRFYDKKIYTWVGDILIAVNPFETLAHLYARENAALYRQVRQNPKEEEVTAYGAFILYWEGLNLTAGRQGLLASVC
jgi:myosin heavy subunit